MIKDFISFISGMLFCFIFVTIPVLLNKYKNGKDDMGTDISGSRFDGYSHLENLSQSSYGCWGTGQSDTPELRKKEGKK